MKKKLLALVLALAIAAGALAGCGNSGDGNSGSAPAEEPAGSPQQPAGTTEEQKPGGDEPFRVAFICKGYSDMFCLSVMNYFKEHAGEYADTFVVEYFDGEVDSTVANNLIESCVTSGFDAIVFQQNDAEAPVEVVKKAVAQGVYVVVTNGHIE